MRLHKRNSRPRRGLGVQPCNSGGFVLLATLWVMTMLSALVLTMAYQVRVEASVERNALNLSQLRLAARGGAQMAVARLINGMDKVSEKPNTKVTAVEPEEWQSLSFGDAEVSIFRSVEVARAFEADPYSADESNPGSFDTVAFNAEGVRSVHKATDANREESNNVFGPDDHESRLNINVAEASQLTGFPGVSTVLAEEIARYRRSLQDNDDDNNATDAGSAITVAQDQQTVTDEETGAGDAATLIQTPIVTLASLLAVEGVTEELLFEGTESQPALADYLTTTSSGRVNLNTATEPVLLAAGLIDSQVQMAVGQRESSLWTSVEDFLQQADIDRDSEKWDRLASIFTTRSSTFHLVARATLKDTKPDYLLQATLFTHGETARFVHWQER